MHALNPPSWSGTSNRATVRLMAWQTLLYVNRSFFSKHHAHQVAKTLLELADKHPTAPGSETVRGAHSAAANAVTEVMDAKKRANETAGDHVRTT